LAFLSYFRQDEVFAVTLELLIRQIQRTNLNPPLFPRL
jgi:hypothetical protein